MNSDIQISGTQSTPTVRGDWGTGCLTMQGDSYPENAFELFDQIIRWIGVFLEQNRLPLRLELHLVYLNTSSVKAMMDIFDLLEGAHRQGRQVSVDWRYHAENERIAELAEEFREDCTFPFAIEPKQATS
ncbi:biofilm regulation phosphoprotein SiaC [Salinicola acroporae]|uniref:SiaC family regulatory phosphoprotein domain-containing protein n=1 Tax=Salinicola acroporae TaxID=1541440 RepID=A0ABT6I535_9GAMM|nr:biofilm regulation phosphoprotein SiaC [Salinicola acroporae]MDH4572631.1 hypothetical protein [Salinicola acroporae]